MTDTWTESNASVEIHCEIETGTLQIDCKVDYLIELLIDWCVTQARHILASKFGQNAPKMEQIWDFLRSVSVHFGSPSQNVLKLILKSPY